MNGLVLDPETWNLISPCLDQALDLEPEQLAGWLDDLQSTQPRIAMLVRELMADRDRLNEAGFLAEPIIATDLAKLNILRLARDVGSK